MSVSPVLMLILVGAVIGLYLLVIQRARALDLKEAQLLVATRERDRAQAQGSAASRDLQALIEACFDPLLIVNASRTIKLCNQRACELFEIKTNGVGQSLIAFTRNHELESLVNTVLEGAEDHLESQLHLNESVYRVRVMRDGNDQQAQAVVTLQDVTELLRLTRARRDMVANFSHDLRTPISSVRLLVDTMIQSLGKNPERDRKNLNKIASAADSLQHMTQELIDLSTIESGKAIMRMVEVPFGGILRSALELMEAQLEEKAITVVNEADTAAVVIADPDQTRRVINNILHNAVKFTPKKGEIRITTTSDGMFLKVSIKDTGPGIPPHERARVFERFYQVDSTRTGGADSKGRGTGLGLAIAKHIIEAHGGRITAESGIPSGANILFTLPLKAN